MTYSATPERVTRMTDAEADKWVKELFEHIAKQHPHLNNREEIWKRWNDED